MPMSSRTDKIAKARPEIELLLRCARIDPDPDNLDRARALVTKPLDWDYLLKMALRQRVMPLVYRQISANFSDAVPEEFLGRLHDYFYLNAARNHSLTDELCEILKLFEAHGIRAVPYKGPALAIQVYKDLSLRQFSDLDILVQAGDVAAASKLLGQRGFEKDHQLTPKQEATFQKIDCEHTFTRLEDGIYLDLHWNFVPRFFSLRFEMEPLWHRLERLSMCGTDVAAFAPEDLLLVLCVHASKDFWDRLIWICDIAELIRVSTDLKWETVLREASRTGAGRILLVSLALASDLVGAKIPKEIRSKIAADSEVRRLVTEITQRLFEDERAGVSHFLKPAKALERRRDRTKYYLRVAITPTIEDWAFARLPRQLSFLHYLTRPVRLVKKYVWKRRVSDV